MFKLTVFLALIAYTQAGIIAPVVHPVVAHQVVQPVVTHAAVVHHAAPIVHAPIVHAPIVPIVKHAHPIISVHHG